MTIDIGFRGVRGLGITAGSVAGCAAERESQVSAQMGRLRMAVEGMEKDVARLRERLQLVSRAQPPTENQNKVSGPAECLCPLADSLSTVTDHVLVIMSEVNMMREFLEI